jgi:hypothetical protein
MKMVLGLLLTFAMVGLAIVFFNVMRSRFNLDPIGSLSNAFAPAATAPTVEG